jgi:uncharacterized SAM-binding protein YcdF (DUF218 family)
VKFPEFIPGRWYAGALERLLSGAKAAGTVVLWLAAFLGLLMVTVSVTPVLKWWAAALAGRWGDERGEVLIVLGGDLTTDEILGVTSYWRSVYAVFCWRTGHYRTVVFSGRNLAGPMADFAAAYGVPRAAILTEGASANTHENALFTAELLKNDRRRKVLLTSDYHMFRALRAFRKAGLDVSPLPFPDAQKRFNTPSERWNIFCLLSIETTKICYYSARGWI